MPLGTYDDDPVIITSATTELPTRETLIDCGNASYGMGNRWAIDWDRFYETLETYGFDMQDLGGEVDSRIRKVVREAVREGEVF